MPRTKAFHSIPTLGKEKTVLEELLTDQGDGYCFHRVEALFKCKNHLACRAMEGGLGMDGIILMLFCFNEATCGLQAFHFRSFLGFKA